MKLDPASHLHKNQSPKSKYEQKNNATFRRKHRTISLRPWSRCKCLKQGQKPKNKNKTLRHKGETDKLDYIKINFCSSEDTTKEVKRQSTEWERIFATIH